MNMTIEHLKKLCTKDNVRITVHAAKRLEKRGISINDVVDCVQTGRIIERYPDDYPYPSCLVLGYTAAHVHLHAVIGTDNNCLFLITAYYPDPAIWDQDHATRREKK